MSKGDFNKVAFQLYFAIKLLCTSAWVLSCKLQHIFRTSFSKNIYGGMFLISDINF